MSISASRSVDTSETAIPMVEPVEAEMSTKALEQGLSQPEKKPTPFKSKLQEAGFVLAVMLGQSFNLTPFGSTLATAEHIAAYLGVASDSGQLAWILAAFSLTTGSFVLLGGRLGDVYGARRVWMVALVWVMIWNLVSGFATSAPFFDACRGLTGIGAGIMLPCSIGLLAMAYPPGKKRNIYFGLFGALAPFSAAGGSIFEVLMATFIDVRWIWWLHAIKNAFTLAIGLFALPLTLGVAFGGSVDYVGAFLGVSGLVLFNFAFIQSLLTGWKSATPITTLLVGIAALVAFSFYEMNVAKFPILPFDIWKAPTFAAVIASAFLDFMSFGIFIYYYYQFLKEFRGANMVQLVAYISPFTVCAFAAAFVSAALIRLVPAQVILGIGLMSMLVANTLLATAHIHQVYWLSTFFAPIFAAFGPDLTFTATQIIASNTVKPSQQGVAGSLAGTCLNYGLSMGVALGSVIEIHVNKDGADVLLGLRGAAYLGIGMTVLGLLIVLLFVRVPKDVREGYDEPE